MVDLSTDWLGLRLRSPLVVGASPLTRTVEHAQRLADAGAGAVVLASVFEEQIVDEQLGLHRFIDSYVDTDAEARSFLPDIDVIPIGPAPTLRHLQALRAALDIPVVASLNGITPGGWTDLARQLAEAGADALELNLYEPPTALHATSAEIEARQIETVAAVVEAASGVPVTAKLSPFYAGLTAFATQIAAAGAAGLVLFNRFYQPDIDLDTLDVDRRIVPSTSAELPLRLHALAVLHGHVQLPLTATGGVHTGLDAAKAILCGAATVQLVSALLDDGPAALARISRELTRWLDTHHYRSSHDACGATALHSVADPTAWERLNYARILESWQPARTRR
ncbi:dihydroorotate dehydrogenase [Mycobacterium kansasii]|uniref:NAD-dependent dihydropyrimidine dehydrogenase subunit PreA n=1 Tax=Mycobacterium innocens TaxID=2341083 RepID=A0A498QI56_9MYCO|nr:MULTISPECIES: dihydroorotate dehydrogenase-like protein [Mycobacterium]KZS76468.1 dihydroorotate dehydrogenase [Mycobacterium kansasii]VBA44424.1 NAD-dependent dihydropyrimidine dehydrogenase subunit PreA [Mycobacterium innocens]